MRILQRLATVPSNLGVTLGRHRFGALTAASIVLRSNPRAMTNPSRTLLGSRALASTPRTLAITSTTMTSTSRALPSTHRALTSTPRALTSTPRELTSTSRTLTSASRTLTSTSRELTSIYRALTSTFRALTSPLTLVSPSPHIAPAVLCKNMSCHSQNDAVISATTPKLCGHTFTYGRQVAAAAYNRTTECVEVVWDDETITNYPYLWLRDNCTCRTCFNAHSISRLLAIDDLDLATIPAQVQVDIDAGRVHITWSDGHESEFSSDWLQGRSFTAQVQDERRKWLLPREPRHWESIVMDQVPTVNFQELLTDDRVLYDWITVLEETGLTLVKDAPREEGQLARIGQRVAFLRRSHYGETFTVNAKTDPSNLAYTPAKLGFHTDLPFYYYTPGMQMLHCIKQVPTKGGDNQFADGFRIAMILKERHPDMFELLVSTLIDYVDIGTDHGRFFKITRQPTIGLDRDGSVNKITLNHMTRDSFLHAPLNSINKVYIALKTYNNIAYEPENHIEYKLQEGEIVCFHNYRVLHGRTGYEVLAEWERHLEGAYIDWDELNSCRRVLLTDLRIYE